MEKQQINYLNMTDTTLSFLDENSNLWNEKRPVAAAVGNIKGFRTGIAGMAYEQSASKTTGATEVLKTSQKLMGDLAFGIVQKLRPYAKTKNDNGLAAAIDFPRSDFEYGKQNNVFNNSRIVLEKSKACVADMADFELTQAEIDALEAAINGVASLMGQRDAIIGKRKTATDGIPELIDRIRKEFAILDDLVPSLIRDEKFVNGYKNNRRIIDR